MYIYNYKAYRGKAIIQGEILGETKEEIVTYLREHALTPIYITKKKRYRKQKGTNKELALFFKEWSALLTAGIPVDSSLPLLYAYRKRTSHLVLQQLERDVTGGKSISEAMRKSQWFPSFASALVHIGEESGTLAEQMHILATWFLQQASYRKKLLSSLVYPCFVLCLSLLFFFIAMFWILPAFSSLFTSLSIPIPLLTHIMLQMGVFFKTYIGWIGGFFLLLILFFYGYAKTTKGKEQKARFLFRCFWFRNLYTLRWTQALSYLLRSGYILSEALRQAAYVTDNEEAERQVLDMAMQVERGEPFGEVVQKSDFNRGFIVQLITIGMGSGKLPTSLEQIATLLAKESQGQIEKLTAWLAPVCILLSGLLTACLVASIIFPLFAGITHIF